MIELFSDLFSDYTLRTVAMGAALLGITAGSLGGFALLRRQSLLGDAISHAALPGIALAFLITGSKAPLVLMTGAALAGWLGAALISSVTNRTRIKYDSALGIMLSVFFGFGLVLLTYIQRNPDANQAGLESFLFGQAAALVERDVFVILGIGALVIFLMGLFWKEFKVLSFDSDFFQTLGFPVRALDHLLTGLFVIAIVIGLQTVGVVLMSAMIIAPGAAARQWTDRLGRMIMLSGCIGAVSGVGGALISSSIPGLPTGPTIVLIVSSIVVFSLLFAPNRGIVFRKYREWKSGKQLRVEAVLVDMYTLAAQHLSAEYPHSARVLDVMSSMSGPARRTLGLLKDLGLATQLDAKMWSLTPEGVRRAELIIQRQFGGEE
ncbi:MAG: metal ABC transporter permease [Bacteroidetes Order II. Incertae sedis bacterium]|nr:metal ABC transporter permease [Bacteroidetes Order II. bacterium]